MGASGSHTSKVWIMPDLYAFTRYQDREMDELWARGMVELSETFALRQHEFGFLVNSKVVGLAATNRLFHDVLDTDSNKLVDKFETMCLVLLCSSLSNEKKVKLMFDLFNFNGKGYLVESEISMLCLSVLTVVSKVDTNWPIPKKPMWKHVVQLALRHFAKMDPLTSLRKQELVLFAAQTVEVARYLDAWRGHASQVLVEDYFKDVFFPCNDAAITPFKEWEKKGLPPSHFVRYRRRKNVGSILEKDGYSMFFTHQVSVLRNLAKDKLYHGPGILGLGSLVQRMLADRWFLNAVAMTLAQPLCFLHLFAHTGQEEGVGRYNTRVFEGHGWRSVFIDDRFPCDPLCAPLFSTTSDSREVCMLVLEKGLAKYLGSYGNIAMASQKHDATMFGMRLLSGGHVYREQVLMYTWKSAVADIDFNAGEMDGAQMIQDRLSEGSLISLARSEGMALFTDGQKKNKNVIRRNTEEDDVPELEQGVDEEDEEAKKKRIEEEKKKAKVRLPPHGRVYPVIAAYSDELGDKFVHVRDAFGELLEIFGQETNKNPDYKNDDRKYADELSGKCRWVKLRLEDLPAMFDTIFISRYPDSLKLLCPKLKIPQWRSDVVKAKTSGPQNPARFHLRVLGHAKPPPPTPPAPPETRLSKIRHKMGKELSVSEDIVSQDMNGDFDYDRYRYFPTAVRPERQHAHSEAEESEEVAYLEPVEISITVSSSVPWAVASTEAAGAKLRFRVVPTAETVHTARKIKKRIQDMKDAEIAAIKEREAKMKALIAASGEEGSGGPVKEELAEDEEEDDAKEGGMGEGGNEEEKNTDKGSEEDDDEESDDEDESTQEDSEDESDSDDDSETRNIKLDRRAAKKAARDKEKKEKEKEEQEAAAKAAAEEAKAASLAAAAAALEEEKALIREVEAKERALLEQYFEVQAAGPQSWHCQNLRLYPGEYYVLCDVSYDMDYGRLLHLSSPKDTTEAPWLENRPVDVDSICLQISSVGRYEVRTLAPGDVHKIPTNAQNVKNVTMQPARWPFVAEAQDEVSSRSLGDLLTFLRRQIDVLGAEFITLGKAFTFKFGPKLKAWRVDLEEQREAEREAKREARREAKRQQKAMEDRIAREEAEKEMAALRDAKLVEDARAKKFAK